MFTSFNHFKGKNELLQKRWVFTEGSLETQSGGREKLENKTPAELMEMLRQEGANVDQKKEIIWKLVETIEASNATEDQKKNIRAEVSEILSAMETSENALEIHRLRFELAGTVTPEGTTDIAAWWEKIKLISPSKDAIFASFAALKDMDWSDMMDGGLDKLMEYGGMIIAFISGGRLGRTPPVVENPETETAETAPGAETPTGPETPVATEATAEELPEQVLRLGDIIEPIAVEGSELLAFKTNTNGVLTEWQINLDGSPLFRKQADGEFRTPNGNFKEIKDEQPLPIFTEYLASHYNDLREITRNIKDENEYEGILNAKLLAGLIKLQQIENNKAGEKLDVLTSIKLYFSPAEQKTLILNSSSSDPERTLDAIREKKLRQNE